MEKKEWKYYYKYKLRIFIINNHMEIIIKNFKKGSQTRLKVSGNMTIAELKKKICRFK